MSAYGFTIIPSHEILRNCGRETVAIVCECGQRRTHRMPDLQRGMPASTPIDAIEEILKLPCGEAACRAVYVSPDDGVAMEG